ncbi:cytochrome c oxidase (ba3-type) subunit I [Aeropyrum pernix]|uniref:Cytochrome c oxidase (Ba3-type) subunit I n=1 Tax=Aeropyrum pernix TaxID=56636 RepID=A0A401H818_AERPX|nr:cbb3-type cytochrome c oxidase subunit I [Aeropyrum pernix]GBF08543.1 cytochrome c oxidase (ba3-type) subunit I [Aeropyrum pernix]
MSGGKVSFSAEDRFTKITMLVAFLMLPLGGLFGILQLFKRTPNFPDPVSDSTYYTALTGHGVVLAIVFTTFFIMGISAFIVSRELKTNFSKLALNLSLGLALLGTVLAAVAILSGQAKVLYTFYPPLKANPLFYIGAALLVVGSWVFMFDLFRLVLRFRRENPDLKVPVATYGILTAWVIWLVATPPVALEVLLLLVPMSLFGMEVDVLLARTLFWWFGHPLVYFWLLPAVALWYYAIPRILGVPLFSETMAKVAYILYMIASTPVGLHHQFVDPGIGPFFKLVHTLTTFVVATPSMLTAFNILATLERAGRMRGGRGLVGWVFKLPWGSLAFSGLMLPIILFANGGITGIINASFQLNTVVHNTTWIVGHFHTTVGGASALTFIAAMLLLAREMMKREVVAPWLAVAAFYMWTVGQYLFSIGYYVAGVMGAPRRTSELLYGGLAPAEWTPWLQLGAIGGMVFWIAGVILVGLIAATLLFGKKVSVPQGERVLAFDETTPGRIENGKYILEEVRFWIVVTIALAILGYIGPLYEIFARGLVPVGPVPP